MVTKHRRFSREVHAKPIINMGSSSTNSMAHDRDDRIANVNGSAVNPNPNYNNSHSNSTSTTTTINEIEDSPNGSTATTPKPCSTPCPMSDMNNNRNNNDSNNNCNKTLPCGGSITATSRFELSARGFRHLLRNFTPSWFSANMGTGIVSILLYKMPYQHPVLQYLSIIIFTLNVILFTLFTTTHVLRYTLYPEIWHVMIRHPAQSLFLGTFPMGFATIINMVAFACVPAWGKWAADLAWGLWVVDAVISLATCLFLPFQLIYKHEAKLETMTAAWLLPIVTTIVASASAGVVASVVAEHDTHRALWTVIVGYILLGTGLPLSMCVLCIYFHRLAIHSLPPKEVIVSVFLPLGPLGQGSFGLMQLGSVAKVVFPKTNTLSPLAGEFLYVFGWLMATLMWGFALVWLFIALASITRDRFPFNMGWWGFVFPLGIFTVATNTFGKELDSAFFRVLGTVFSICVIVLWIIVATRTILETWNGNLLVAPCLKDLKPSSTENDDPGKRA